MKRSSTLFLIVLLSVLSVPALADQVYLNNGDRLTGKIVKKDGDKLVVETHSMGTVSIAWADVKSIVSDEQIVIKTKDGEQMSGLVYSDGNGVEVTTSTDETVHIASDKIDVMRSEDEQKRYDAEVRLREHPKLAELWTGFADVGFSLTSGNSTTRALNINTRAQRETVRNKIVFYFNAIQAQSKSRGATVATAKGAWTGVRYDRNIDPRLFVYGGIDLEHDRMQKLRFRTVLGAGFGYKALVGKRIQLDVFGGASANRENYYTGLKRFSAEGTVGDDLKLRLNSRIRFNQRFSFYPSISMPGRVRAVFDSSLQSDINNWLGWHLSFTDRYNSYPTGNLKTNDVLMSTGLRVKFGKKK